MSQAASDAAAKGSTEPGGSRRCGSCDQPRMEIDLAVECDGQPRTMGHHQEAAASSSDEVARERQNVVRRRLVEIAGGLVGEQQQRLYRQRAADCDPLLLAAGQLLRVALEQAAKAKPLHQLSM